MRRRRFLPQARVEDVLDNWLGQALEGQASLQYGMIAMAVFGAGFLRGFLGFGAALVTVPIISIVLGPRLAVPIVSVMALPSTLQLLPDAIRHSERRIVLPISAAIFFAAPFGTWVLATVDPGLMKITISVLVIVMVLFLLAGWELKKDVRLEMLLVAGSLGGLVQGASGMGGPPAVAVALSRLGPPESQRGNVLAVMTAITLSSWPPLYYFGLLVVEALWTGIILFPLYSLATWVGGRYFTHQGRSHFRPAALVVLAVIGIGTFIAATLQ